jgi:nicotinamide-nucleotide amidase
MKAEIISIGTEITSGQNLDTNSQWLSQQLAEIGCSVAFHTTVGDNFDDNIDVFRTASRRVNLVLATGGLGPTLDDLTRDVLAKAAGVELQFHEPSFRHIEQLFASRKRAMPERNRIQALFPIGSEPLENPIGTAPGIWMKIGNAHVAAMPGVPTEMHRMYFEQVRPRLSHLGLGDSVLIERRIHTFGAGESAVEEKLRDLTRRGAVPEVGITASDATITLRIIAKAATVSDAEAICQPVEHTIRERLGNLVYSVGTDELHDVVIAQLRDAGLTIATAESVTAGLVAHKLANVPGASACLRGGIVCYDSLIKEKWLDVPVAMLNEHSAVSAPVAEAIAASVRTKMCSDIGVGVVGYAGPTFGGPDKPVGAVFVTVAGPFGNRSATFIWPGTRVEIQVRAAKMALNLVRLYLMEKR